jgi:hypothetical protein
MSTVVLLSAAYVDPYYFHFHVLIDFSGVKTKLLPRLASMLPNSPTVPKAVQLPDILVLPPLTFLSTAACLPKQDLNQPGRCLPSNLQASFLVNKVAMVDPQPNPQDNMLVSKWHMVVLLVLVAMVVVSQLLTLSGVLLRLRASAMALVAIRDDFRNRI